MKNISELMATVTANPQQALKQPKPFDVESPLMMRLWLRMQEMYGTLWTQSQGTEPNETWALGIHDLTPEQIGLGLTALRDSRKPFPPTLPEFLGLCKPASAPGQHMMARSWDQVEAEKQERKERFARLTGQDIKRLN